MSQKIQQRRGTATEWSSANPILSQGEFGFELDTANIKIGDGLTAWSTLPYIGNSPWIVKTANYTAVNGDKIQADTTSGIFTIKLPLNPNPGDSVTVLDAGLTWLTFNLTIDRNLQNIAGSPTDFLFNANGAWGEFVYYNVAVGWNVRI